MKLFSIELEKKNSHDYDGTYDEDDMQLTREENFGEEQWRETFHKCWSKLFGTSFFKKLMADNGYYKLDEIKAKTGLKLTNVDKVYFKNRMGFELKDIEKAKKLLAKHKVI
jgi:hypothetical protein